MVHFSNAKLLLYLWAEGNFSETLLYGDFLSIWTDQVDLGPAHLKHQATAEIIILTEFEKKKIDFKKWSRFSFCCIKHLW